MINELHTFVHQYQVVIANTLFLLVYGFIIWERIPKVVVTLLGSGLAILLGILTQTEAFAYIDFNVIFLLVGMMIMVNIIKQTGAFEYMAYWTLLKTKGNAVWLMLAFAAITAVASAFLDNVTTVIFMASITCSLAARLKIDPKPYLITEIIASNIGGTSTLIGDPPNIMIGSAAGLSFTDFLFSLTHIVVLVFVVACALLVFIFRKDLKFDEAAQAQIQTIELDGLIKNKKLLIQSLVVLSIVLLGFMTHHLTHFEVSTIALTGGAVLMLFEEPQEIWNDVEWDTIFFFIGLFILVGAVEKVGTLDLISDEVFELTKGNYQLTTFMMLWVSGIASAIIDNIPFTATTIPVIQNLANHYDSVRELWWALSLGACLGGNGSLIGATANVLVADMSS
ncbi:MAG: ArsB/NhaD family transporter, partial [Cyanobacteria bacterium HKST-UBA04]|nr:ArsB/NhaD family transporter [Cyanobacteria bacterium HKST-UBA04]